MATVMAPHPSSPANFGILARLRLPEKILEAYRQEANDCGVQIEDLLASRLTECVTYNATKPLYFNDDNRRQLEKLLGRNVQKPGDVLSVLAKALSIKINGINVSLKPDVLERLRTRHHVGEFGQWLGDLVNKEIERFVGLR